MTKCARRKRVKADWRKERRQTRARRLRPLIDTSSTIMTVIPETLSFSDTALLDLDSSAGPEQTHRVAVDAHIRYATNVVLIVGNLNNVRL